MTNDLFTVVRGVLAPLALNERLELLEHLIAELAQFGHDAEEQLQGGVNPITVLKAQAALRRIRQGSGDPHERLAELFGVSLNDVSLITRNFDEGTIYSAEIRVPPGLAQDSAPKLVCKGCEQALPATISADGSCKNCGAAQWVPENLW